MSDVTLREMLNAVFVAHAAWEDAATGDPKMEAWDALCEAIEPATMDAILHLARLEFRRIERMVPVGARSTPATAARDIGGDEKL